MRILILLSFFWCSLGLAQYEDYRSYETFGSLDSDQRDYGLILSPSFIYTKIEENNQVTGGSVSGRSRDLLFYDVQLGYIFRSGFYFGILYTGESQDILDLNDTEPRTSRESLGASFGYIRYGWAFRGTLFPYSKQTLENTAVAEYTQGWGYQVDVTYYMRLGRFFSVGPQVVFKSFQYKKAESAATSVNADATSQHDVITPMISLMINIFRG